MTAVREYIIQVVAVSLLCSIILKLLHGSKVSHQIMKTVCGIAIAITVISPVMSFAPDGLPDTIQSINMDGKEIARRASEDSQNQLSEVITNNIQAYILSKASSYDCNLDVKISLDGDTHRIPVSVEINADVSPFIKKKIQDIIEAEIGIPKERQIWN